MENQIKQYFRFPGESLHQTIIFLNSLFYFHHFAYLTKQHFYQALTDISKTNRNYFPVGFFFDLKSIIKPDIK